MMKIDTQGNRVLMSDGREHVFTRRWEATVLALLVHYHHSGKPFASADLDQELARHGQKQPLNRAQKQRLFDNIKAFIATLPGVPLTLVHAPRKATVGPWEMKIALGLKIEIPHLATSSASRAGGGDTPRAPVAIRLLAPSSLPRLRQLINQLVIAESLAERGHYLDASERLEPVFKLPLSPDAHMLLKIREAQFQKFQGDFAAARQTILDLLAKDPAELLDQGLLDMARFYLDRIDYDASPGQAWKALWNIGHVPEPSARHDPRVISEWHNLRALLARRCLLDQSAGSLSEAIQALHEAALAHFEAAIYWATAARDWGKVQAYSANLAHYLYCVIPMGLSEPAEVFHWHALVINHEEKLDVGHETAWEFIFLGQFWLDYEKSLAVAGNDTESSILIGNLHPRNEDFYVAAIQRLEDCADLRQVAIAWINYGRFAKRRNLRAKRQLAINALDRLFVLLPDLKASLEADGYTPHLVKIYSR